MSPLQLPPIINFALLCLIFFPFVEPREAPEYVRRPDGSAWYTARTLRGAGLERDVELVCTPPISFKEIGCLYLSPLGRTAANTHDICTICRFGSVYPFRIFPRCSLSRVYSDLQNRYDSTRLKTANV